MKILVTGAAGMLASDVVPCLRKRGHEVLITDIQLSHPDIKALDVTDRAKVFKAIERNRPDFVFHLAAATNVDRCQQEPDWAFVTNTLGTENVAQACGDFNASMLYVSTGSVFNGKKGEPYTEFDHVDPSNLYAKTKWEGEEIVRTTVDRFFIVRAGWMVGGWEVDKKFVYKIVQQVLAGNRMIKAVDDKFGSPTFTWDFAESLMTIIDTGRYGLFHLANRGTASRYEIACKIVEFMGRNDEVDVIPISSEEFPLPAPRAHSEMLRNYKLDLLGLNNMPAWEESLKLYIARNTHPQNFHGEKVESTG